MPEGNGFDKKKTQYQIVLVLDEKVSFEQAESWVDVFRELLKDRIVLAIVEPVERTKPEAGSG